MSSVIKSELSFFISPALRGKNKLKITGVITDAKKNVVAATTICLSNQDNKYEVKQVLEKPEIDEWDPLLRTSLYMCNFRPIVLVYFKQ